MSTSIVIPVRPATDVYSITRVEEWITDEGERTYRYTELHLTPNYYIRDWVNRSHAYPDFTFSSAKVLR